MVFSEGYPRWTTRMDPHILDSYPHPRWTSVSQMNIHCGYPKQISYPRRIWYATGNPRWTWYSRWRLHNNAGLSILNDPLWNIQSWSLHRTCVLRREYTNILATRQKSSRNTYTHTHTKHGHIIYAWTIFYKNKMSPLLTAMYQSFRVVDACQGKNFLRLSRSPKIRRKILDIQSNRLHITINAGYTLPRSLLFNQSTHPSPGTCLAFYDSWIGSALPHRANSRQTIAVKNKICSRTSPCFRRRITYTSRKKTKVIRRKSNPRSSTLFFVFSSDFFSQSTL